MFSFDVSRALLELYSTNKMRIEQLKTTRIKLRESRPEGDSASCGLVSDGTHSRVPEFRVKLSSKCFLSIDFKALFLLFLNSNCFLYGYLAREQRESVWRAIELMYALEQLSVKENAIMESRRVGRSSLYGHAKGSRHLVAQGL